MTLLETLTTQLRQAARHNPGETAPECVVWCDPDRQWLTAVSALRAAMPELLTLGDWNPGLRQGPSFWLRLALDRSLADLDLPEGVTPVVYLRGVARGELRAGSECPDALKPLVDLLYSGTSWTQANGRDWTLEAVLTAREIGLSLDVARDERTRRSALGSLSALLGTNLTQLRGKRLEAEDFDKLMIADPARDLLTWLSDPSVRQQWDSARWGALRSRGRADYGFDPETDGPLEGGVRLASREGAWRQVWERFGEAPSLYPGIPELLRQAQPIDQIAFDREPWPKENTKSEAELRDALTAIATVPATEARARIKQLEAAHGMRRSWPWARLGMSPSARALKPLAALAALTAEVPGGESLEVMAAAHADEGWRADQAVLEALREVTAAADVRAVECAVQGLYRPWLDESARRFQELAARKSGLPHEAPIEAEEKECLLFADGLRFDLGRELASMIEAADLPCVFSSRWSALPTVTATAKPYVMPVAGQVSGAKLGETFEPIITATAQTARIANLRKLLESAGYQVLPHGETGDPDRPGARAWTEAAEIDHHGHAHGAKLARHTPMELQALVDRIQALLAAGWRSVRVVTDHGWLLLPGGLPKVDLPKYLSQTRWSRCAVIKESAHVAVPLAPWSWNPQESFAHPHGISCFGEGNEYAHGGLSLQECLLPVLRIAQSPPPVAGAPSIVSVKWKGLRCEAMVQPLVPGYTLGIRTKASDVGTSIAAPKPVTAEKVSVLVEDDALEGASAALVLLDASGTVVSRLSITVGEG